MGKLISSISGLLIIIILQISSALIIQNDITENMALVNCLDLVTERYISSKANTLLIKEKCNSAPGKNIRLLEHFLQNRNSTIALQLSLGENFEQPWKFYVFIVCDHMAFKELRFHIPNTQHERDYYFLVILNYDGKDQQLRQYIKLEIFRTCMLLRVLHVVIIEQDYEQYGIINFFSYTFFGAICGQDMDIIKSNRYENGILDNDQLFPLAMMNFNGCTLNVTIFIFPPWVEFNGDAKNITHTKDIKRLSGIEGIQLRLLAQIINFQISLRISKLKGVINQNENSTGPFLELETQQTNVAIGGFTVTYENRSKLTSSVAYRYTPYLFAVRSDLHFGPLKQLTNPFELNVWTAIFTTILLAFISIKIANHCNFLTVGKQIFPNINLFTILLGNPIAQIPKGNTTRFLLMSWMLFTLILRNAYQGKLYDALRVSRRETIPKSVAELIQYKYKLVSSAYFAYYPENLTIIMPNMIKQLYWVQKSNERLTVVTTPETLGYYYFLHHNFSRLSFVTEPVHALYSGMYFQKHSILKSIFDVKIRQLMYAGITKYLNRKYTGRQELEMINSYLSSIKVDSISNKMLQGLYYIYGFLNLFAFIIFILELLSAYIKRIQIIIDHINK